MGINYAAQGIDYAKKYIEKGIDRTTSYISDNGADIATSYISDLLGGNKSPSIAQSAIQTGMSAASQALGMAATGGIPLPSLSSSDDVAQTTTVNTDMTSKGGNVVGGIINKNKNNTNTIMIIAGAIIALVMYIKRK